MKTSQKTNSHLLCSKLALACGLALLAAPTWAATESNPQPGPNYSSPADGPLTHEDRKFILKAAEANRNEIAMGKLGLAQATRADVRSFAQQMVDDHSTAEADLESLANKKGVALDSVKTMSMDSLAKKSGNDFDEAFSKHMVSDHDDAVALFKKEATDGKDKDLIAYATKYLPKLTSHFQTAKALKKATD